MGIVDDWAAGLKPATRRLYVPCVKRLMADSGFKAEEALQLILNEYPKFTTYSKLRLKINSYSDHMRGPMVYALHNFLVAGGVQVLPRARVSQPPHLKAKNYLTWEQALSICAAASKPYNVALNMMLHCGWGISEFLKFNTAATWKNVQKFLASNPQAEYFRFDFTGRKRNIKQFYSLIPTSLLREALRVLDNKVPITAAYGLSLDKQGRKYKTEGILLDLPHYHSARTYLETAFRTAVHRAPITLNGSGVPSPHELRDTFRTRAQKVDCNPVAAEFAMGHGIDPLGYNKIMVDTEWMWNELKKIYGPSAVTEEQLKVRDKELEELRAEVNELREVVPLTYQFMRQLTKNMPSEELEELQTRLSELPAEAQTGHIEPHPANAEQKLRKVPRVRVKKPKRLR
jgi:integrase